MEARGIENRANVRRDVRLRLFPESWVGSMDVDVHGKPVLINGPIDCAATHARASVSNGGGQRAPAR